MQRFLPADKGQNTEDVHVPSGISAITHGSCSVNFKNNLQEKIDDRGKKLFCEKE